MAFDMHKTIATHRQTCAMAGCSNRTFAYYTRRSNPSGAVWMCDDCIKAMHSFIQPGEAAVADVRPGEADDATPKARRGRK